MRWEDDGAKVTLDLHGVRVDDVEALVLRALRLAFQYGRISMKIVHGNSTSETLYRNRTIKYQLYELIESGALDDYISDELYSEGFCTLILHRTTHKPKTHRINPFDVFR
ncbi:MAG: Smr/MutS family protein [Bacteroidetes Order II. Incertae sedis bacterium]|nr:Smr/MutS family protein [Bacteroidetes Order II. bacterium]